MEFLVSIEGFFFFWFKESSYCTSICCQPQLAHLWNRASIFSFYFEGHMMNSFLLCKQGKYDQQYEQSEEFQRELKLKVREILTDQEWRRRKMQMRVCWKISYFLLCYLCSCLKLCIFMILFLVI